MLPVHRLAGGASATDDVVQQYRQQQQQQPQGPLDMAPGANGTTGAAEGRAGAWRDGGGGVLGSFTLANLPYGSHWMWWVRRSVIASHARTVQDRC